MTGLSVSDLITRNATSIPQQVALSDGRRQLDYRTLDTATEAIASTLDGCGLGPRDRVGVAGPRDARLLVASYAVLRLQCCALVIDGEWKADETARRLTAIGAKYVVSTVPTGDIDYPVPVVVVDVDRSPAPGGRPLDTASALHAPAYIAYTSGSTGEPKAVEVTHASLLHYGFAVADRLDYGFGGGRTFGHLTTLSADLGHTAWMLALVTGGRTHVFEDHVVRDPSLFWAQAAAAEISCVKTTPSHFAALLDGRPVTAPSLETVILGGEKLPSALALQILRTRAAERVVNHYGPTETTIGATCFIANEESDLLCLDTGVPIGAPIGDVVVKLIRTDGTEEDGTAAAELLIGGPGVSQGYVGRPEDSARAFVERDGMRFYRSRDLCRRNDDGELVFERRLGDEVKIRGHRVDLALVESVLCNGPDVGRAALTVRETSYGPRVAAAVRFRTSVGATEALACYLREHLPAYAVPAPLVAVTELPVDGNGKIDRVLLAQTIGEAIHRLARSPSTRSASAATSAGRAAAEDLAAHWAQLLGLPAVDVDANVSDLGGDSILAMRTVVFLRRRGWSAAVDDVYRHPTAMSLVQNVCRRSDPPPLPVGTTDGSGPALSATQTGFFGEPMSDPDHWNQVVVLRCGRRIGPAAFARAVTRVVEHHAVLRRPLSGSGPADAPRRVEELDPLSFSPLPEAESEVAQRIQLVGAQMQKDLDLRAGRLVRFHVFRGRAGVEDRFLALAHHLVIDTVSWRILLDDLAACYRAELTGLEYALSATADFYQVARQSLPTGVGSRRAEQADTRQLTRSTSMVWRLDAESTQRLRAAYPRSRQLEAVLVAAFAGSIATKLVVPEVTVEVETHGRETVHDPEGLNAVGWFTAVRHVTVPTAHRTLPASAADVERALATAPVLPLDVGGTRPEFGFNFLGAIRPPTEPLLDWHSADETAGSARCSGGESRQSASATARIVDGRLVVDITYRSASSHDPAAARSSASFAAAIANLAGAQNAPSVSRAQHSLSGYLLHTGDVAAPARAEVTHDPARVLLTGGSGFLGRHILSELVDRRAQVTCLIREGTELDRDVYSTVRRGGVSLLTGDITAENLGLAADSLAVFRRSQLVVHAAADVRIIAPPEELHRVNVDGVKRVLDVLSGCDFAFHHVSSLAVAGHVEGVSRRFSEADLCIGQRFLTPYDRSKFNAELTVRAWKDTHGLECFVYRSGHVAGHSRTGEFQRNMADNRVFQMLRGYVLSGFAPSKPTTAIAFSFVDTVAKGIVTNALSGCASPGVYHVESPHDIPHDDVVGWLDRCGYDVRLVDDAGFGEALNGITDPDVRCAAELAASWAGMETRNVRYDRQRTVNRLAAAGIGFAAPTPEWLAAILGRAAEAGHFPAPRRVLR